MGSKRKQFTIITTGNRFGEYLCNGMSDDGYYSKWRITYNYYREWDDYKQVNVENVEYSLLVSEIKRQTVERTKEWYDKIHRARGDYPGYLDYLDEQIPE